MILSEEKAKGKICPQTFARGPAAYSGNFELNTCIGSGCMAWRWMVNAYAGNIDRTKNDDCSLGYCGFVGPQR